MSSLHARSSSATGLGVLSLSPDAELLPRRSNTPGTTLELLVLVAEGGQCAGIDLISGALVRAWSPEPIDPELQPYDVVGGTIDDADDLLPDPTQPEAVPLIGSPDRVGRITGRRVERYLRALVHPPNQPLLGSHGPAVPFWQRSADHPSIGIVEPEGPAVIRQREIGLTCMFGWRGMVMDLPCLDRRLAQALASAGRTRVDSGRGERLVVALAPPVDGHCHKVVAGLLPRP